MFYHMRQNLSGVPHVTSRAAEAVRVHLRVVRYEKAETLHMIQKVGRRE